MTDVKFMSLDGAIVPAADARVHILSPSFKYAVNVFEGIRGYWNAEAGELYLFRLREHVERLRFSMKVLAFDDIHSVEHVEGCILDLIRANDFREDTYIRLFAYVDAYDGMMTATGPSGLAIAATPRGRHAAQGMRCGVSSWSRIPDNAMPPRVKCVANYHHGRLVWLEAKANGHDGAIILTTRGKVSEGPGASLMMVRDGRPITPSLTSDILESITRDTVIRLLAEDFDRETEVREVDRTELYAAEEMFFCGTALEITPILSVDKRPVGSGAIGPLVQALGERFTAVVRGQTADHVAWRTPVHGQAR